MFFQAVNFVFDTGKEEQVGEKLCGFVLPNDVIIKAPPFSEIEITFKSDNDTAFEGFAVEVLLGSDSTRLRANNEGLFVFLLLHLYFLVNCFEVV